jgi:hypothetical protein
MSDQKRVPLNDDPNVIAYQLFKRSSSGKSNLASAIKLGKGGQAESYNAKTINQGLANNELVGFMNVTEKGGVMVIRKSTPMESKSKGEAPTA